GNYNPKTARLYEDLGLLSADPDLGADLSELFNYLTGYSRKSHYRKLLVAPLSLRSEMVGLIQAQSDAGPDGRIVMKMNSLVDSAVIDELYAASQAGVSIDLVVRGICCLRPGVAGLSENIRVRSIVGRYLEHSRIYAFGQRDHRHYLIGSADLMPRNLDRRVEAVAPVEDAELQGRLQEILDVCLSDDLLASELNADGSWHKVDVEKEVNAQFRLHDLAFERARRRREAEVARRS
ncbi:MAG: RNA degradosome polyphosphate kinase, partial [Actinomycetota bacterium]|nr:RNA degradosome polyphosphate kinase [Actinomycetota bacterium]